MTPLSRYSGGTEIMEIIGVTKCAVTFVIHVYCFMMCLHYIKLLVRVTHAKPEVHILPCC